MANKVLGPCWQQKLCGTRLVSSHIESVFFAFWHTFGSHSSLYSLFKGLEKQLVYYCHICTGNIFD